MERHQDYYNPVLVRWTFISLEKSWCILRVIGPHTVDVSLLVGAETDQHLAKFVNPSRLLTFHESEMTRQIWQVTGG